MHDTCQKPAPIDREQFEGKTFRTLPRRRIVCKPHQDVGKSRAARGTLRIPAHRTKGGSLPRLAEVNPTAKDSCWKVSRSLERLSRGYFHFYHPACSRWSRVTCPCCT